MKNSILGLAMLLASIVTYGQDYKGLSGHLNVHENVWILDWLNNDYKILEDNAYLILQSKDEVEELYNDIIIAMESKEGTNTIVKKSYKIVYNEKTIILYNNKEQNMMIPKKYAKNGILAISESIQYMKK
jgi:hypothetical protein